MKKTIDDFINPKNDSNGLLIADMPTGFGKTYHAARSIENYVNNLEGQRKIFFITTLKKNFPEKDLRKAYEDNNLLDKYNKDVLVIKSNFDYIYENLLLTDIPEEYKYDSYYELRNKVELLIEIDKRKDNSMKKLREEVIDNIRKNLEPVFRKDITKYLKDKYKDANKRRKAIKNNKELNWIEKIYPTVFMDDYKIYFLTIDKFLVKNSVLVEPSYYFTDSRIIQDSIIFIDEFDSGKETIEKNIISRALSSREDYIKLFLTIYRSFTSHIFSKNIINLCNYNEVLKTYRYTFNELRKEAKDIFVDFKLQFNYKTDGESINKKQSFLFNDSSYHTMLRNNCNYIRASVEEINNRVAIYFENKDDYYRNRKDDDIIVYSLVRKITSFLNRFRIMVLNLSSELSEDINKKRSNKEDEFTIENAIKTICSEFKLSETQRNILMNDMCDHNIKSSSANELIPDMSFYKNGFKYFEFKDSDEHYNETVFNFVNIYDTPEKIIAYLSNVAKVIGISATGRIKTVTGNYDLDYLENILKDKFLVISDETYKVISEQLSDIWSAYDSGEVNINTNIVNFNKANMELVDRLEEIFEDKKVANRYANRIINLCGGEDSSDYFANRYCNIFAVIKEFLIRDDIKSFLCLNMMLPSRSIDTFNIDIFNNVMDDLAKLFSKNLDANNLVILRSENFDLDKEAILNRLSLGEKLFIMSSYKTIGAGQNLQYPYPSMDGLVQLSQGASNEDGRLKNKDIDAIFLGDITNTVVNLAGRNKLSDETLLKHFFQIEYLYESDEINYKKLDSLIKYGFDKYSQDNFEKEIYSNIRETKSVRRQITRDVIQALGRMSRTFIKNKNVYIYVVEELLGKVDIDCLGGKILTPEMKSFVELVSKMGYKHNEDEKIIINRAERKSSRGNTYIMGILSRGWTKQSMELWKEIRKYVLRYPTANDDIYSSNDTIKNLYISSNKTLNTYLYAQKGDFSDTLIEFFADKEQFSKNDRCKDRYISEVSETNARLKQILNYRGLKEYFHRMGYAIEFKKDKYILSPVLFNNIYKGALGEVAGKFILEQELGIKLKEIDDESKFEFFDFEISKDVYVDFKHWKFNYLEENSREKAKKEIENKLIQINGKKVYIINIISDGEFSIHKQKDGRIIEIPFLINSSGEVNIEALRMLEEEVYYDKYK
ncbi:hypothetical protein [Clostridium baratii]|uniref:hypothetical protein n=1 Tax=Clostridium baratii TaxID=1561 RepID=UPI001C23E372|nr:hypothetical protein [Clostridium baratii]